MRIVFPPVIGPEKVRELADEYRSLEAEQIGARESLKDAERAHREAQEADSRSLAAAIRAGAREPDGRQARKAEEAVGQATRRLDAVAIALESCEAELLAAVEDARAGWLEALDRELGQRRDEFAAVVEELAAASDRLGTAQATVRWVSEFSGAGGKALFHGTKGAGVLTSWRLPNGSSPSLLEVLTALRELAQPKDQGPRVVVGQFAEAEEGSADRSRSTWLRAGR